MCIALAFLKQEHVEGGFVKTHYEAPDNEKTHWAFRLFCQSLARNLKKPFIPVDMLPKKHRTTNAVEGWHLKINNILLHLKHKMKDIIKSTIGHQPYMRMEEKLRKESTSSWMKE